MNSVLFASFNGVNILNGVYTIQFLDFFKIPAPFKVGNVVAVGQTRIVIIPFAIQ